MKSIFIALVLLSFSPVTAQQINLADSVKKDTMVYTPFTSLPLKPERQVKFNTKEGTWMSVDISPDGSTIAFDLMGDIYTIPINGGKATQVTKGIAYETEAAVIISGTLIWKNRIPFN